MSATVQSFATCDCVSRVWTRAALAVSAAATDLKQTSDCLLDMFAL